MVAVALDLRPGWEVLDSCSASGNKTVHLAALMRGEWKIIACEQNKERVKLLVILKDTALSGPVIHQSSWASQIGNKNCSSSSTNNMLLSSERGTRSLLY